MAHKFLGCDRDQSFLMPPSLDEWLPPDHLARFVIAMVDEFDLAAFYLPYRLDGHGRPAHDPSMMVALLLYAYARGQRSSRVIERECVEDIAFRLIAANRQPENCTIARFRQRHETALAGLFGEVLALCARAGLAGVGVVAVDGTKVHANASHHANRDYEQIAREILQEAAEVDASRPAGYLTRLEWRRPDPRRILRETAGQAAAGRGPSVSSVYPAPTVEANAVTQGPGLRGTTGGGREAYRLDGPDGARGSRRRGEDAAIGT